MSLLLSTPLSTTPPIYLPSYLPPVESPIDFPSIHTLTIQSLNHSKALTLTDVTEPCSCVSACMLYCTHARTGLSLYAQISRFWRRRVDDGPVINHWGDATF